MKILLRNILRSQSRISGTKAMHGIRLLVCRQLTDLKHQNTWCILPFGISKARFPLRKRMPSCRAIMKRIPSAIQTIAPRKLTRFRQESPHFFQRRRSALHRMSTFPSTGSSSLGFIPMQDVSGIITSRKKNAWYFRNALVRANYNDLKNGIHETTEFLELFLRNLLLNENHPLHNRRLHISGTFKGSEKPYIGTAKPYIGTAKPYIGTAKPDIEAVKMDIEKEFQSKTLSHILKLREAFTNQAIFGRSDVMSVIAIKSSRASELLAELVEKNIIEPVYGHGKGKYRFKMNKG